MEFAKAVKKPFTDMKALLIGILLSILPIVRWFTVGYILDNSGVAKNRPASSKLHAWDNWGDLFVKGLAAWVISFIYMIPAIFIMLIGVGNLFLSLFKTYVGGILPTSVLQDAIVDKEAGAVVAILQQNWAKAIPALINFAPVMIVALLLMLVAGYLLPVAILNYIASGKFGEAFSLGKVFKMAFTGEYFFTWVVILIVSMILGSILAFIPVIGPAFLLFTLGVFKYTLFGEIHRKLAE